MAEEFLNQISAKCSVIIIGAGQAGLSIAHSLQKKGIKPLILEKNYVGFSWKEPVSYTHLTLPTIVCV